MESYFLHIYADEMKQLLRGKAAVDRIRNIAVILVTVITIAMFSSGEPVNRWLPFIGSFMVFALVLLEANLFRLYAVTIQRVQLLEQDYIPGVINKENESGQEQQLAMKYANLTKPSFLEAVAYRIYKNYFLLFLVLDATWLAKVYLSPEPSNSFRDFLNRLHLGFFSNWGSVIFVVAFWALFSVALFRINAIKKRKAYLHE